MSSLSKPAMSFTPKCELIVGQWLGVGSPCNQIGLSSAGMYTVYNIGQHLLVPCNPGQSKRSCQRSRGVWWQMSPRLTRHRQLRQNRRGRSSRYLELQNKRPFFNTKPIVFQGQFSILSAFSIQKTRIKLAFLVQFSVLQRFSPFPGP